MTNTRDTRKTNHPSTDSAPDSNNLTPADKLVAKWGHDPTSPILIDGFFDSKGNIIESFDPRWMENPGRFENKRDSNATISGGQTVPSAETNTRPQTREELMAEGYRLQAKAALLFAELATGTMFEVIIQENQ